MVYAVVRFQGFDDRSDFSLSLLVQSRVGNAVLGNLELAAACTDQDTCLAALVKGTAVDFLRNLLNTGRHDVDQGIRRHVDEIDYDSVVRVQIRNCVGNRNGIVGGNDLLDFRCGRNYGNKYYFLCFIDLAPVSKQRADDCKYNKQQGKKALSHILLFGVLT